MLNNIPTNLATASSPGLMSSAQNNQLAWLPKLPPTATPLGHTILAWWSDEDLTVAGGLASWPSRFGGGLAAVQATEGNQPSVELATSLRRTQVRFTKATPTMMTISGLVSLLTTGVPSIYGSPYKSHTILVRYRPISYSNANLFSTLSANYYGTNNQLYLNSTTLANAALAGGTVSATVNTAGVDTWAAYVCDIGVSQRIVTNGMTATQANTTAFYGDSRDSYAIGSTVGQSNAFDGWIREIVVILGALTDAEIYAMQPYLYRGYQNQIAMVGNSLMTITAFPSDLADLVPTKYIVQVPYALGGALTEDLIPKLTTNVIPQLLPLNRICFFYEWGNSILNASATLSSLQAQASTVKAWAAANNCKLMTATITARTAFSSPQNAIVAAVNADMLANPTTWSDGPGYVVDLAAITAGSTSDGTHWDATRAAACARSVASHITALFGQ